jgi:hypothetical protein
MPSYSIYLSTREDAMLASAIENTSHENESQAIQHAIRETYGDDDE